MELFVCCSFFFFFNDTATTEIYTLSLHDALPIWAAGKHPGPARAPVPERGRGRDRVLGVEGDRKSTRLNSSHLVISYAVFCLKKKKYTTLRLFPNSHSVRIHSLVLPSPSILSRMH